ncbi:MAG: hypothetical protein OXJ56_13065, partial [Rhodospirillaceae bacterium]|nr:hypothetical protein [Rhodospirillaceae bacterium]
MGFVTLGFFVIFQIAVGSAGDPGGAVATVSPNGAGLIGGQGAMLALQGGMVQMISHGLISGALFLCV